MKQFNLNLKQLYTNFILIRHQVKKYLFCINLILASVFISTLTGSVVLAQSHGGSGGNIYIEETFFPKYVDKNDTTSITGSPGVASETGLGFDTRTTLGYVFGQSFLFGLTYNNYSLATDRKNVSGGSPGLKQTTAENQFGPTIGWLNGGFRATFTMFMSGNKEVRTANFDATGTTVDATIKNDGLSGFQATVGYTFGLWGMELGPSLAYTSISYSKQSNLDKFTPGNNYSNTKLFSKTVDNNLSPMLTLIVRF
jgi:hypothetical protein